MNKVKRYLLVAGITTAVMLAGFIILMVVTKVKDSDDKAQTQVSEKEPPQTIDYKAAKEACRNAYPILDEAPAELSERVNDTYEGIDSLVNYEGASEPIKVASTEQEFIDYCEELFFDYTEPISYISWDGEVYIARCGVFEIYRTEYFNPTTQYNSLVYMKDAGMEGMTCNCFFFYDCTGKYAMIWEEFDEAECCIAAKFIGLQFGEEYPYIAANAEEIEYLSARTQSRYSGRLEDYYAKSAVVRVVSSEEEFVEYCETLFADFEDYKYYEKNRDGEIISVECGAYSVYRTQYFTPTRYSNELRYEGIAAGDTEPPYYYYVYDSTGKYALVFNSFSDPKNLGERFMGFYQATVEAENEENAE